MIQAFLALARLLVARARIVEVDVVVAHARLARAARCTRIAEVIVSAFVATSPGVANFAVAPEKRNVEFMNKQTECIKL